MHGFLAKESPAPRAFLQKKILRERVLFAKKRRSARPYVFAKRTRRGRIFLKNWKKERPARAKAFSHSKTSSAFSGAQARAEPFRLRRARSSKTLEKRCCGRQAALEKTAFRGRQAFSPSPKGRKRYPVRGTVRMSRGFEGSSSSFFRRLWVWEKTVRRSPRLSRFQTCW